VGVGVRFVDSSDEEEYEVVGLHRGSSLQGGAQAKCVRTSTGGPPADAQKVRRTSFVFFSPFFFFCHSERPFRTSNSLCIFKLVTSPPSK
jgi:hypothetical protein